MKKLIEKDKKIRYNFEIIEKKYFILRLIFMNFNIFILFRWISLLKLIVLVKKFSKTLFYYKCLFTLNKKRFCKLSPFSRYVFLKFLRANLFVGIHKLSQ